MDPWTAAPPTRGSAAECHATWAAGCATTAIYSTPPCSLGPHACLLADPQRSLEQPAASLSPAPPSADHHDHQCQRHRHKRCGRR
eukprot:3970837-Alexandrium_andersonii.AAC.1